MIHPNSYLRENSPIVIYTEYSNGLDEQHYSTQKGRLYRIKKLEHKVPELFVASCKKKCSDSCKIKYDM